MKVFEVGAPGPFLLTGCLASLAVRDDRKGMVEQRAEES